MSVNHIRIDKRESPTASAALTKFVTFANLANGDDVVAKSIDDLREEFLCKIETWTGFGRE